MSLTLLPDLGDLLRLHPQYNAGTVVELVRFLGASEVLWASSDDPDHPLRDALPAARIRVREGLAPDWGWAEEEHGQLQGFLGQYPQGRERLRDAARAEREFTAAVTAPLTPARAVGEELLGAARAYHAAVRAALDEGPGTRWRERRLNVLATGLLGEAGVVIAPLDDLLGLLERLPGEICPEFPDRRPGARLPDLRAFVPGETSRLRALADRAWRLQEDDDLNALLAALDRETGDRVTPGAELHAAAAGLYLAVGDLTAARERLERAAHALTDDLPRSLAGLTLARLGQVRDALGDRELAVRTYRAVLALAYVPAVARETATAGLQTPFTLDLGEQGR